MLDKRILFICNTDPELKNGGGIATKAYILAFCNLYPQKVDLILPVISKTSDLPVNFYFVPERSKSQKVKGLFTGSIHRYKNYVVDFLKGNSDKYFLCIFNGSVVAGDLINFVINLNIRTITIHHNYEKKYHVDNKTIESFKGIYPYFVIRNERNAFLKSDVNLFLTRSDENKLHAEYGKPNGASYVTGVFESDTQNEKKLDICKKSKDCKSITLVISGSLNTFQTKKGIYDFYKKYFNLIKKLDVNFNLIITGRNPSCEMVKLFFNEKGIEIVANPVNMYEIIKKGDIYLCPTNVGSGLKLRLLDGLQNGLPILTHKISARGYETLIEKQWFKVYDDSASFIEGLNSLVNWISEENGNIDQEIIQTYKKYFGFEQGIEKLRNVLLDLNL